MEKPISLYLLLATYWQRMDELTEAMRQTDEIESVDPMVGDWQVSHAKSPDMLCGLVISAHRFTGRYEGDGLYLKGNAKTDAITYRVRLLADPIDGYRAFHVSRKGEPAMLLPEHSLNTFIGRRIA